MKNLKRSPSFFKEFLKNPKLTKPRNEKKSRKDEKKNKPSHDGTGNAICLQIFAEPLQEFVMLEKNEHVRHMKKKNSIEKKKAGAEKKKIRPSNFSFGVSHARKIIKSHTPSRDK